VFNAEALARCGCDEDVYDDSDASRSISKQVDNLGVVHAPFKQQKSRTVVLTVAAAGEVLRSTLINRSVEE
jgi:hypothetical protein